MANGSVLKEYNCWQTLKDVLIRATQIIAEADANLNVETRTIRGYAVYEGSL
jgi:hypothetical protein